MSQDYSMLGILKMLGKWKKHILIATAGTFVLACIITLMMPNYYKANTVFYAANPDLATPTPLGGEERFISLYGNDHDLDRLFTIANSKEIYDFLIDSFNLAQHYDIDTSSSKGKERLYKRLNKLYSTTKTKYDAMSLSIEDVDPVMSKNMVGAARQRISTIAQELIKSSQQSLIESKLGFVDKQQQAVKSISDTLQHLKEEYKIYDSNTQAEILAELITNTSSNLEQKKAQFSSLKSSNAPRDTLRKISAVIAGLESKLSTLDENIEKFNSGLLTVRQMELEQIRMGSELALEKERLSKLLSTYESDFSAIHIVEQESVPIEKSRPRRSIIVLGFTALAFLLSCLAVLFIEGTRNINWKEVYAGE